MPSSSVIPVRDGDGGIEVLMVRRPEAGPFGGAFVFPGGKVDPADHGSVARKAVGGADEQDLPWRAAALRELGEEAGLFLTDPPLERPPYGVAGESLFRAVIEAGSRFDARRLAYVSNWVTPVGVPARFDTRFYLAAVAPGTEAFPADGEVVEAHWVPPATALERGRSGRWAVILPTVRHLEMLTTAEDVDSLIGSLLPRPGFAPVQPRMVRRDGRLAVRVPGEDPDEVVDG